MYEFSTECMVFGERSPVFQANCSVKSYCSVGAAHVRPAAVRQTTSCGKAAGRALVGAQRAPTVCKQTRSCGCLPRRGKHCSRPGFVPLNRGPTLTTPQCPARGVKGSCPLKGGRADLRAGHARPLQKASLHAKTGPAFRQVPFWLV